MIDFHTHILPAIDDGSRNLEESLAILEQQKAAGITKVMATPHFYPDDKIEVFLHKRSMAVNALREAAKAANLGDVALYTGAEVLISVDTWKLEQLGELCIEGTNYILIEMPYSGHWSDWVYSSIESVIDNKKLIPIIAHVERYDAVTENPNVLLRLIEMGAILQVNAYSLTKEPSKAKLTHRLVKHGMIHVLGSDVHRAGHMISVAGVYEQLTKIYGQDTVRQMHEIGEGILNGGKVQIKEPRPLKKILGRWY